MARLQNYQGEQTGGGYNVGTGWHRTALHSSHVRFTVGRCGRRNAALLPDASTCTLGFWCVCIVWLGSMTHHATDMSFTWCRRLDAPDLCMCVHYDKFMAISRHTTAQLMTRRKFYDGLALPKDGYAARWLLTSIKQSSELCEYAELAENNSH
jgi:hypothetical protein